MKKLTKAVIKSDLNAVGLANAICDIVIEHYGKHNYEDFKRAVNDRLKPHHYRDITPYEQD